MTPFFQLTSRLFRLRLGLLGLFMGAFLALVTPGLAQEKPAQTVSAEKGKNLTAPDPQAVVARAGEFTLTVGELQQATQMRMGRAPVGLPNQPNQDKLRRTMIESLLTEKAISAEAERRHLDRDPNYAIPQRMLNLGALAQAAAAQVKPAPPKDPTEADLKQAYDRLAAQARQENSGLTFHFIIFKTVGLDEAGQAAKRKLAEKTLARLKGGEDFVKVMKEVSEAEKVAEAPIHIKPGAPGFSAKFYQQLSALKPGQTSEIIENKAGLFIFRMLPVTAAAPPKPFEQMLKDPKEKAHLVNLARQGASREENPVMDLVEKLKGKYKVAAPYRMEAGQKELPADATVLVRVKELKLTMGELKRLMAASGSQPTSQSLERILPRLVNMFVLAAYGQEQKLEEAARQSPSYKQNKAELDRTCLLQSMKKELKAPTQKELTAHYVKNQARFRKPDQLSVERLLITPRPGKDKDVPTLVVLEEAKKAAERVEKGSTLEAEAKHDDPARSVKLAYQSWKDQTAAQIVEQDALFPSRLLSEPAGKLTEPLKSAHGYALYRVQAREPGALPALTEVRAAVEASWQSEALDQQMKAISQRIHETVKIDQKLAQP